jgi:hypothetical protein
MVDTEVKACVQFCGEVVAVVLEAASISETSVNHDITRRNNPERTCRQEEPLFPGY